MRGKKAPKRMIKGDSVFHSVEVAKFINYVMRDGKKTLAERIISQTFKRIEDKTQRPALETFEQAIKNVSPTLEVKSRRVGGANYQVPIPVRAERRFYLACHWILGAVSAKKGRPTVQKLTDELLSAAEGTGDAVKKKQDVQRMAEANRAFAHFAK